MMFQRFKLGHLFCTMKGDFAEIAWANEVRFLQKLAPEQYRSLYP